MITQNGWRWCYKCQGFFFAGNPSQGVCPVGGSHDASQSANYAALSEGAKAVAVQTFVLGDPDTGLSNFQEQVVARVAINRRETNVLILGKVVISNLDGDAQNATARLTWRDGAVELDRADLRIPGGNGFSQSVFLDGWITNVSQGDIVDLRCSTFSGLARKVRFNVIGVDDLT